jgi:hypothetical protein
VSVPAAHHDIAARAVAGVEAIIPGRPVEGIADRDD